MAVWGKRTRPHVAVVLLLPAPPLGGGIGAAADRMHLRLGGRLHVALAAAGALPAHHELGCLGRGAGGGLGRQIGRRCTRVGSRRATWLGGWVSSRSRWRGGHSRANAILEGHTKAHTAAIAAVIQYGVVPKLCVAAGQMLTGFESVAGIGNIPDNTTSTQVLTG